MLDEALLSNIRRINTYFPSAETKQQYVESFDSPNIIHRRHDLQPLLLTRASRKLHS